MSPLGERLFLTSARDSLLAGAPLCSDARHSNPCATRNQPNPTAVPQQEVASLEREIDAGSNHPKIVM